MAKKDKPKGKTQEEVTKRLLQSAGMPEKRKNPIRAAGEAEEPKE